MYASVEIEGGENVNNKIIIAVIAVLVVAGGILLLSNQSRIKNQSTENAQSAQESSGQQATSPAASESSGTTPGKREAITINVTKDGFSPASATVKTGTIVTWINKSGGLVTVNSSVHPTHLVYPPLNLGEFKDGSSVQLTFDKPGVFKYHDHLDASHTGIVTVE